MLQYCALHRQSSLFIATHVDRSELCRNVLNDQYISSSSGSEVGFTIANKNVHEENLLHCEDQRFEVRLNFVLPRCYMEIHCLSCVYVSPVTVGCTHRKQCGNYTCAG